MKKISTIFLALCLLPLVACQTPQDDTLNDDVVIVDKAEILNNIKNEVVELSVQKNDLSTTVGFFISNEHIYTTALAVKNAYTVYNEDLKAEKIVSYEETSNYAVLKVDQANAYTQKDLLDVAKTVAVNEVLYIYQNDQLIEAVVESINNNLLVLTVDANINDAVVVNKDSEVVGIATLANDALVVSMINLDNITYQAPKHISLFFGLSEEVTINKENLSTYFEAEVKFTKVETISDLQMIYAYEFILTPKVEMLSIENYQSLLVDIYYDVAITYINEKDETVVGSRKKSNYFITNQVNGVIDQAEVSILMNSEKLLSIDSIAYHLNDISGSILIKK